MLGELPPPGKLIEARRLRPVADRTSAPEILVVVATLTHDRRSRASNRRLLGEVIEIDLAKRAIVEPVVAHPAVHHRTLGNRRLQRRMRMYDRHDHGEPFVGAADHPYTAVRFGKVPDEPIDRVVRV